MPDEEIPVLIIGGSLVGLTTAMLLGHHGVPSLSVERHAGTAIHPRAGHFQLRTMETIRQMGLEERVRTKSLETYSATGGIIAVESLAGRELATYVKELNEGVEGFSPTVRVFINQDALEPILRERALELGATVRNRTEAVALDQDDDGVTATLRDLDSGTRARCARATSSPPTATAARCARGWASACAATRSSRAASPSTSAPTAPSCCATATRASSTCTTRSCAGSSGSTAAAAPASSSSTRWARTSRRTRRSTSSRG